MKDTEPVARHALYVPVLVNAWQSAEILAIVSDGGIDVVVVLVGLGCGHPGAMSVASMITEPSALIRYTRHLDLALISR
jgi:hypothetical protein